MKRIQSIGFLLLCVVGGLSGCSKKSESALNSTDEVAALRQEVAALREEVGQLRHRGSRRNASDPSADDSFANTQAIPPEMLEQLTTLRDQLSNSQREIASNLVQIAVDRGGDAWRRGDFKEALKLLKPLAEDGHPIAAHRLGVMYVLGQGVPKDSAEAIKLFTKAGEQGQGESQHSLGLRYLWGDGTEKNPETAAAWFTAAANQGIPDSATWLGDIYWNGNGVQKDVVEGYKWLILSKDKFSIGRDRSVTLEQYVLQLTPEQKAEAEQRARDFVPQRTGPEDF